MGKLRMLAISLIGTGLFASCSASSDSADLVELTTTSTIATTTIAQPSSSTTEASTTTSKAQTTTSEATPTTTLEELTAEIEADLQAGRDLVTSILHNPSAFDAAALSLYFSPSAIDRLRTRLDERLDAGWASRPGPTATDDIAVESVTVLGEADALVITCLSNDAVVFDLTTGAIINDDAGSVRYSTSVAYESGIWRTEETSTLGTFEVFGCE